MKKVNMFTTESETSYFSRIRPGKKAFIGIEDGESYNLQINAITEDHFVYLERVPGLEFCEGQIVNLWIISFDALYNYTLRFEKFENANIILSLTGDVDRIQRRFHIREFIYGTIDFAITEIDKVEKLYEYRAMIMGKDLSNLSLENKGKIINISGGGFLLEFEKKINSRDYVVGVLNLIDRSFPFMGQVIRVHDETGHYGIKIIFISNEEREYIIHKIFELHRKYIGVLKEEKRND